MASSHREMTRQVRQLKAHLRNHLVQVRELMLATTNKEAPASDDVQEKTRGVYGSAMAVEKEADRIVRECGKA